MDGQISQVRRFNRVVTQRVGALNDHFLGRDRPLGEARLLYEIGAEGAEVRELRTRLGLDSGYVSRLLRSLEQQGLIEVVSSAQDRRVRRAQLTRGGRAEFAELDRRADGFAECVLAPLTEAQRGELVGAMRAVERLLLVSAVTIELADPTSAEAQSCLEHYFHELGQRFEHGFDARQSIPADAHELVLPAGAFVMARSSTGALACGALKARGEGVGDIKRMWVVPTARGLGIGGRILAELERHARTLGLTVLRLETNRTLHEAQALYRRHGYREVERFSDEPYAHFWFEKRLAPDDAGAAGACAGRAISR